MFIYNVNVLTPVVCSNKACEGVVFLYTFGYILVISKFRSFENMYGRLLVS